MSAVEVERETEIAVEDDSPAIGHIGRPGWRTDPEGPTALCGARLIGVPAPEGHQTVCAECLRLCGCANCQRLLRELGPS